MLTESSLSEETATRSGRVLLQLRDSNGGKKWHVRIHIWGGGGSEGRVWREGEIGGGRK